MLYDKESLHPILRRTIATTTYELIYVDIMPSGGVTLKNAIAYQNLIILVAAEHVLYDELDNIIASSHETISMGDLPSLHQPDIDWVTREVQGGGGRRMRLFNDKILK